MGFGTYYGQHIVQHETRELDVKVTLIGGRNPGGVNPVCLRRVLPRIQPRAAHDFVVREWLSLKICTTDNMHLQTLSGIAALDCAQLAQR